MDSSRHADQMEKMLRMLEDLQNIKISGDQNLSETESETLALNEKVETLERSIKTLYHILLDSGRQCECSTITSPKNAISRHPSPAAMVTDDINDDMDKLRQQFLSVSSRSLLAYYGPILHNSLHFVVVLFSHSFLQQSVEYVGNMEYTGEDEPKER